jgi:hypothetical protein
MRASMVSRPTLLARMMRLPGPLMRRADNLRAGSFTDGHGFSRHHRFIERILAHHVAVDGDALAWSHAQPVADRDRFDRYLILGPIRAKTSCGLWGQIEKERAAMPPISGVRSPS